MYRADKPPGQRNPSLVRVIVITIGQFSCGTPLAHSNDIGVSPTVETTFIRLIGPINKGFREELDADKHNYELDIKDGAPYSTVKLLFLTFASQSQKKRKYHGTFATDHTYY